MAWYVETPSETNTLKRITICSGLCRNFALIYYSDKGDSFR